MSEIAIRVENLSKRYRIGLREERPDTFGRALLAAARRPFANLRRLRSLSALGPAGQEADDIIWALRDVSFEVKQGEAVGIIGRNGAGKSTLLKILSRITYPSGGRVTLHGRVASLLEVGTGFHPELTGRENIYLNGTILGMRKAEIDRKLDEIIAFAELEKFLDTPVKRYSSGMYVRLAFAVAAHLEPEILLVDEVLAVGDLSFQSKCLNKMQDVAQVGRTVLFVSHNLGAIHRLCPRCILLNQGELIADEQTEQVVGIYVSRGMADRPEYVQPGDSQKPIHLRQVCLMTIEGQIASEFRYDQGFQIEIKYDVNQPIVDCSLWLAIRTAEETIVFGTADSDTNSSLYKRRELGYYSTRVELPPRWLNVGRYYLVVGIVQSGAISLERIEVSGFSVIGVGVPELNRPGILQPLINWTTTKVV